MKKSFVIRVDEETFKLLEAWAQDEFRSVNGQIEFLIHQGLQKSGRMKKTKAKNINGSVDESN